LNAKGPIRFGKINKMLGVSHLEGAFARNSILNLLATPDKGGNLTGWVRPHFQGSKDSLTGSRQQLKIKIRNGLERIRHQGGRLAP